MMSSYIKSRQRVRDHGEVFTPEWMVREMLSLVKVEVENIESRFLEPACGDGNFLSVILEERLSTVSKKYKKSQADFERYSILSLMNVYGIDLLEDNVQKARERLLKIFKNFYEDTFKNKTKKQLIEVAEYVLSKNIVQGDALTMMNNKGEPIIFPEWSPVNHVMIKRRDFSFAEILKKESMKEGLFQNMETEDLGLKPVREYPVVHYLKITQQV